MKILKKVLILVLCLALVQIPVSMFSSTETVQAAAKDGLVKSGSNYYYYSNGKKVTNKWVMKVYVGTDSKGAKVYKRMYFGSNGAAYRATSSQGKFVVKTIAGKQWGFDTKGYLMPKGLYVGKKSEKFFYFNATGTVNTSISNAFNKAAKYEKSFSTLSSLLKKYGIKATKTTSSSTCYFNQKYVGGKDYTYTFANFRIGTTKDKNGKNEIFMYAESR